MARDALREVNQNVTVCFLLSKGIKLSTLWVGTNQYMDYHIVGECRNPACTMRATACISTAPRMVKVLAALAEFKDAVAAPAP